MPNRLTGSVYRSCAFVRPVTAPVGSRLASSVSMYALICTTPRLTNDRDEIADDRADVRRCELAASASEPGATRSTAGSWTTNCSALPATEPHASTTARRGSGVPAAEHDQRRDHRGVPHHGRGVREQEAAVAVQHAEAPGRQHEQPGAGKQNAHELDRQRRASRR